MSPSSLPSIDLVLEEARSERQGQLLHFEALDAKAGVVLGFAGALVALAPTQADPLLVLGRSLGVISGLAALSSFWPRRYWLTDLRSLREGYLTSEVAFTKLRLIDAMVVETTQVKETLIRKARLLKIAMAALALSVSSVAAASA
jgi:hypothetical protein